MTVATCPSHSTNGIIFRVQAGRIAQCLKDHFHFLFLNAPFNSLPEPERIVGVMGFSQGTRVATGVCLDGELGQTIQFAILIAGTFPVLSLPARETESVAAEEMALDDTASESDVSSDSPSSTIGDRPPIPCLRIPSVHIQSTNIMTHGCPMGGVCGGLITMRVGQRW
ncbi:hypothetical protein BDV28DRAFT_147141 [Aspergillus coremiiformis]|uniref:Serine hydrolase FSH domain-containing protein n=1 Tax=Aspergillus coremiiformis TaxID=138285 RepID=A0A5N6ZE98_9EURO|nr:hypothetical protein BDV28DRAFT_147141 [Aspergillus coremiiformis]